MLPSVPWLIFSLAFLCIIAACWGFVVFFKDPAVPSKLPTLVSVVGLVLCLLCLLIIPLDILNVNSDGSWGDYHVNSQTVKFMYYTCYGILLLVAFLFIPFAYFFFEEERMEDEPSNRLLTSLKYTAACVALLALLVCVALTLGFTSGAPTHDLEEWARGLLLATDKGEKAAQMLVGLMALVGLLAWLVYTPFGMAYLPLALWSSNPTTLNREAAITTELGDVLEDIRAIECRVQLTGIRPSKQERNRLARLQKRKDSLEYQQIIVQRSRVDRFARCCGAVSPLLVVLSVLAALVILVLVLSMFLRALDCALHPRDCKGSILVKSRLPNPLDLILVLASRAFPLDYIFIGVLVLVVFSATLAAISRIGVIVLWLRLHKLYRAGTSPQGLLLACELLIFIIITFSVSVVIITPQYMAFGHQTTVIDGQERDCTMVNACLNDTCTDCRLTQLASMVNTIDLAFPMFGTAYLWSQWLFLLAFLISVVVCLRVEMPSLLEMWYPADIESLSLTSRPSPWGESGT